METPESQPASVVRIGRVIFDLEAQTFKNENGNLINLRPQSHAVLLHLANHQGELITKQNLFDEVWGNISVTDDSLVQCVREIRLELGDTDRKVLQTVPRRGYRLTAEKIPITDNSTTNQQSGLFGNWQNKKQLAIAAAVGVLFISVVGYLAVSTRSGESTPTLNVKLESDATTEKHLSKLEKLVRVSLSKYRTVILKDDDRTEYQLRLSLTDKEDKVDTEKLFVELVDSSKNTVIFATQMNTFGSAGPDSYLAARISAAIASPGGGAIGRHLLSRSMSKPTEELSKDECYAHGYGCPTCSGESDTITPRAIACLAHWLEKDPNDARAWALKSTILTRKHWFGVALDESEQNDPNLQQKLRKSAVDAANKAEQLSDGSDSAIYWGMAQAYVTSCQPDKLRVAIQRGLQINPDDPNLLASFGNWLTYSGFWDEGSEMTRRALEIEPKHHKNWWWYAIAKSKYMEGDYQAALDDFMKSFNDRNWLSHLQLAYTLPYLGRHRDAKSAATKLTELYPGFTRTVAKEFYQRFCFPPDYLEKMDKGLEMAGLPATQ